MLIFVPKPVDAAETRIPLVPDSARRMIELGARVTAVAGLGEAAGYPDSAYTAAGVTLVDQAGPVRAEADLIFGLEKPAAADFQAMKTGAIYLGLLDPFNRRDLLQAAAAAGIRLISMEMIPRTTLAQKMDVLSSQANLAGYMAVVLGSERLTKILPMMMTPAGTITPARVFVIGVGVAGLQAIATAKRLGARVEAFDTRPVVEEQVKSLGAKFVKIDLGETGQTEQGYARALTPEQIALQQAGMSKICAQSDIVITTAKLFGRPAPTLVTREMVAAMSPGSIVVDLAAETGGNVEGVVVDQEIITENGVRLIGHARLETRIPYHASQMLAANYANFVDHFWNSELGGIDLDRPDEILQGCLMTRDGTIVHPDFQ